MNLICLALLVLVQSGRPAAPPTIRPVSAVRSSKLPATDQQEDRVIYFDGAAVGSEKTTWRIDRRNDRVTIRTELQIATGGFRPVKVDSTRTTEMKLSGDLIRFSIAASPHQSARVVRSGEVRENRLMISTRQGGRAGSFELPWDGRSYPADWLLWRLRQTPLSPRERFRFSRAALETDARPATVSISAGKIRNLRLPDGSRQALLPVTVRDFRRPNETLRLGLRDDGVMVTREFMLAGLRMTSQLVTEPGSVGPIDIAALDRQLTKLILCEKPATSGRMSKRLTAHVSGVPGVASQFEHPPRQTVEQTPGDAVRVSVLASEMPRSSQRHRRVDRRYLASTSLVDCAHPHIVRLAREAAGGEADSARAATAMQKYVNRLLRSRVFSAATAPASEIALSRAGDCTEHAVLLTALLRARRIPARVATGLIYVEGRSGFVAHMWTEAMINGEWTALDAVSPKKPPDAGYLQIGHSALTDNESVASVFQDVAGMVGQLRIRVLEAE